MQLAKIDLAGELVWGKRFGGVDYTAGYAVQQTLDGGYIATGSWTFGDNAHWAGHRDVYLIKTTSSGEKEWERTYGGDRTEQGFAVQQTTDGGYVVAGFTGGGDFINNGAYLLKVDPDGNPKWERTLGNFRCQSVQQTPDGGYVVAGWGYLDDPHFEIFVARTDTEGRALWVRTYGGPNDDFGYSVVVDRDGSYVVLGSLWVSPGPWHYFYLFKVDSSGSTLWQTTFGQSDLASPSSYTGSVQLTRDGGYVVVGSVWPSTTGSVDVYLAKLSPERAAAPPDPCAGASPSADRDADGLSDREECERQSNPDDPASPDPCAVLSPTADADRDGISELEECLLGPKPEDSDGDAIPDRWEIHGYDFITQAGQVRHVDLPGMGADPNKPDVFVQVDWMFGSDHSHQPCRDALLRVVKAFAEAPNGKGGINLWVTGVNLRDRQSNEIIGNGIDELTLLTLDAALFSEPVGIGKAPGGQDDWRNFDRIKSIFFLHNTPERERLFHYCLFVHNSSKAGLSRGVPGRDFITKVGFVKGQGCVGTPGDIFIPLLGPDGLAVPPVDSIAVAFMHELGHNLGLGHGGLTLMGANYVPEDTNNKPNHLSVMNYSFVGGLIKSNITGILDYSIFDIELSVMHEALLNEELGVPAIGLASLYTTWYYNQVATKWMKTNFNKPTNFNGDRTISRGTGAPVLVAADINGDSRPCRPVNDPCRLLPSVNEWKHLVYDGGGQIGATLEFMGEPLLFTDTTEEPTFVATPVAFGDLNGDGAINVKDFQLLRNSFGRCNGQVGYLPIADLDADGCVTLQDYQQWYRAFRP